MILSSRRLRRAILPEGSGSAPYEVLECDTQLSLEDERGAMASFDRRQVVRFTQDGVSAILDYAWGDGVFVACYHNTAGRLLTTVVDRARKHLIVGLRQTMARDDVFQFDVGRTVIGGFRGDREWVETVVANPVRRLRRRIVFPKGRPCQSAVLEYDGTARQLAPRRLADGRTLVGFTLRHAQANLPYIVRWNW